MRRRIFSLALCAALLAPPLFAPAVQAKPADFAPLLADPLRSPQMVKLDAGRKPAEVLDFAKVKKGQKVFDFFAGSGTTGAAAGHGLVGTFAAGVGFEFPAQHSLTRRRNVGGPHDKIKIGRAGDKNHGGSPFA